MKQYLGVNFWIIAGSATICLLSYQGALNPYPLGLISALTVSAGLILISLSAGHVVANNRWIFKVMHSTLLSLCVLITVISWYYFDYFQSLFTFRILALGGDISSGRQALDFAAHANGVYLLGALLLLTLIPVWRNRRHTPASKSQLAAAGLVFVIALLVSERALSHYRERGAQWLVPSNLHPVHAFFSTPSTTSETTPAERKAFDSFKNTHQNTTEIMTGTDIKPGRYNVIVILMESVRADLVGLYNGQKPSFTPNFDALATQGIISKTHYSNTTHTVSAEINLWCGVYDRFGEAKLTYFPESDLNFSCLPTTLNEIGYESLYFHGNKGSFYNRTALLPKLGFEDLYFYKDQENPLIEGFKIGWGVDDVTMFSTLMAELRERESDAPPFFAHLTTISNHYPFHWEFSADGFTAPVSGDKKNNSLHQNYQNMVAYTDYALGRFWREFTASRFAENTIVVVTSDHGIWQFANPNMPLIEKNERFFRAPLFIYHPQLKSNIQLSGISSHLDVPVTLAHMLGLQKSELMIGNNLLAKTGQSNRVVMGKGTDIVYRNDDIFCYFDIDDCSGNQQSCRMSQGEVNLLESAESYNVCQQVSGDLLGQYQAEYIPNQPVPTFESARLMRSFIHKQIVRD